MDGINQRNTKHQQPGFKSHRFANSKGTITSATNTDMATTICVNNGTVVTGPTRLSGYHYYEHDCCHKY